MDRVLIQELNVLVDDGTKLFSPTMGLKIENLP